MTIVKDEATGERILEIEVRGKRGVGYCKSMPGAVLPFERLRNRLRSSAPESEQGAETRSGRQTPAQACRCRSPPTCSFARPIANCSTRSSRKRPQVDREGQRRTAYSLRHTYICMRLMEGADIYQIAKNCRTSVEMIEKYYASHIKNTLDAAAINVRKPKMDPIRRPAKKEGIDQE